MSFSFAAFALLRLCEKSISHSLVSRKGAKGSDESLVSLNLISFTQQLVDYSFYPSIIAIQIHRGDRYTDLADSDL